jgi:hypothetical protein
MNDPTYIRDGDPRIEWDSMMEPNQNDISGLSQISVSVTTSREGRQTLRQRPIGLTITIEKVDRVLTDVQAQIEHLRRYSTNLGLGKAQLAGMEAKCRGEQL